MFWIQTPLRIRTKPIAHLISSSSCMHRNSVWIDIPVRCESAKATGKQTPSAKTESNRNVMNVFPPERIVK